jgi:acyl-CoA reductase-like NAD-dependent aldehyde dehydrogenase
MRLTSTNPARNYEEIGSVAVSTPEEITQAVAKARMAQPGWQALGVQGRVEVMSGLVKLFHERRSALAEGMSRETGRPIVGAEFTVDYSLRYWDWNLENAENCLAPTPTYSDDQEVAEVVYEPAGVAAVITPWNFPFSNFTWGTSQNLLAGNTVAFKISEEVPLFGKLIDELFEEAGVPDGVFNQVYGAGDVGARLLEQDIDLISFTGSTATGRSIYKTAAEKMIPVMLEMGGSDPGIIFADANVPDIIHTIYFARFLNSGQICDSLKRLIVHESRFDDVVQSLSSVLEEKRVGDPTDRATDLGPLVSERQLLALEAQVEDARQKGANFVTGGKRPAGLNGAFYEPTILTNVTQDMCVWREEVFGPVLPVVPFKTFDEAIALARDTEYGLGSYIFTVDHALARKAAAAMRSGMVRVNNAMSARPTNPFMGHGLSGIGAENGVFGFHEVCRRKLVARNR